jgi:hypothetical protein
VVGGLERKGPLVSHPVSGASHVVTCHPIPPIPLHGEIGYHRHRGGTPITGRSHNPFLGSSRELELNIYRYILII